MAMHKEPYGLVYNDDGSLCVTIREDDTPFAGVKSFAVEEGTTNLLNLSSIIQSIGSDLQWDAPYVGAKITSDLSTYTYTLEVLTDNSAGQGIILEVSNAVENTQYTVSGELYWHVADINNKRGFYIRYYDSGGNIINDQGGYYHQSEEVSIKTDGRFNFTLTTPAGTTKFQCFIGLGGSPDAGDKVVLIKPQIEKKPFATSFVDGTRQDGIIQLPVNLTPDNFVISFWAKLIRTDENIYWLHLVDGLSSNGTTEGIAFAFRGSTIGDAGKLEFLVRTNNSNAHYISTVNYNDIKYEWHFYTIKVINNLIDVFFDNQKIIESVSIPWNYSITKLYLGRSFVNPFDGAEPKANGFLMSNLYIGNAKDDNGNLVWTDEYIQELYNARKPFSTPPRMPVI